MFLTTFFISLGLISSWQFYSVTEFDFLPIKFFFPLLFCFPFSSEAISELPPFSSIPGVESKVSVMVMILS